MVKKNVMVVFGGKSGEHEVSLMSASSILRAINRNKYNVINVGITKDGVWKYFDGAIDEIESGAWEGVTNSLVGDKGKIERASIVPKEDGEGVLAIGRERSERIDVVFPVLHGPMGEDGTIQGLLEMMNIPYVGAGVLASAVAMDKAVAKKLFQSEGISQAEFMVINRKKYWEDRESCIQMIEAGFKYPVFVKPANLGSSVGISKAKNREQLLDALELAARYDRKLVVEEFIDAREIECSVLGNDDPIASLPAEIIPSHEFYDYQDKYFDGQSQFKIPADISEETAKRVREMAVKAYRLIDCSGLARVDFFIEKSTNKVLLNEINTMPGFTKISMYPKMWEATGISYEELIDRLIELAIDRYKDKNHL
jgi:D-alanine-D-alanine ligase